MRKIIFLNGKFISPADAQISVFDPGLLYGQGLFETMRSYDGLVFALDKHLKRFFQSLPTVEIKCSYSGKELTKAISKVLRQNNLKNAYIRLTIWQGEKKTNTLIFARNFNGYPPSAYKKGFQGLIMGFPVNEKSPLVKVKATNYLLFLLARKSAEEKGFDEALFLNTQGFLCEASHSNIFLVQEGKIFTPALKCGCLPGVTREIVISLARKLNIPVKEAEIKPQALLRAKEAFLTSSLMEVMPLTKLGSSLINKGRIGEITSLLQKKYKEKIVKPKQNGSC